MNAITTEASLIEFYPWQIEHIADHSVIAIATFKPIEGRGRKLGSIACRQLLECLTRQLEVVGTLCEEQFPYGFITADARYYVSFSHSQTRVAVLLSHYPQLGVDIETKAISTNLVERYFGESEQHWLKSLPIERQAIARTLLWTLKESTIKSGLFANHTGSPPLITGIQQDMAMLFGKDSLENLLKKPLETDIWQKFYAKNYWLGFNLSEQCGFIIAQNLQK